MNRQILWLVILVVLFFAVGINLPNSSTFFGIDTHLREGLDLQGGLQVLLEADVSEETAVDATSMDVVRKIIEDRVNGLGVSEPIVQVSPPNRIVVELPGYENPDEAIALIRNTALLEFVIVPSFIPEGQIIRTTYGDPSVATAGTPAATSTNPNTIGSGATNVPSQTETAPAPAETPTGETTPPVDALTPAAPTLDTALSSPIYKTLMTGAYLKHAQVGTDNVGKPVVLFELTSEGAAIFGDYTQKNVGGFLAIVLDKRVISCPTISSPILGGSGEITGSFTNTEANQLAVQLKYGSLPVPLKVVRTQTVGPTLGQDSLRRSLVAGIIGVATVALFMLLYYRLPGVLADLALLMYALTTLAAYRVIPVTFTLPGIAGFILSVGMAVDANILIFERLKEELRAGRVLKDAVEIGFSRAWLSIRDSNLATLLTCGILYWFGGTFGASIVKGFAVTLAVGVSISMFTAIVVTRNLLHLVLDRVDFSKRHSWFGL